MIKKPSKSWLKYIGLGAVAVVVGAAAVWALFPNLRPAAYNPYNDLHYTKYRTASDTAACLKEWSKYHSDDNHGRHLMPPPCPGVAQ